MWTQHGTDKNKPPKIPQVGYIPVLFPPLSSHIAVYHWLPHEKNMKKTLKNILKKHDNAMWSPLVWPCHPHLFPIFHRKNHGETCHQTFAPWPLRRRWCQCLRWLPTSPRLWPPDSPGHSTLRHDNQCERWFINPWTHNKYIFFPSRHIGVLTAASAQWIPKLCHPWNQALIQCHTSVHAC